MHRPRYLSHTFMLFAPLLAVVGMAAQLGTWSGERRTYAQAAPDPLPIDALQNATITFANPSALQITIGEGDDFATKALGDPWDMDNPRDLGYEIGFNNISTNNGIWSGTYSGVDQASGAATSGYLFPLFQGFSTPVVGGLSQELSFNKVGAEDPYAISTTKYTRLSYRLSVSQRPANGPFFVQWSSASPVTWPQGENRFGRLDACQGTTQFFPWQGWHTYNFDLTQPQGDAAVRAGAWQNAPLVRGLRLDPAATAPAGTEIKIDWIRLSDPTSAPQISIPWSTSGIGANDRVDIYLADSPSGANASPIAYNIAASAGSYNLPTSMLPPGQHYFQLRLKDGAQENGCTVTKSASAWAGPLTITPAPIITFAQPSMTSGPDYATSELGQAWNMDSSADIVTPGPAVGYPQTLADTSFSNSILRARAVIIPPQIESDAQFWLRVDPNRPINTNRYRYFTVRLKVDLPAGKDINWAVAYGWGGRVIWWNQGIQQDGSETKYGTYYPGWRNYSVDLARAMPPTPISDPAQWRNILTPREQNSFPAQLGWTQLGTVSKLRYDPLETMQQAVGTGADIFEIDWVRLTANDEVRRGQPFRIEAGLNIQPSELQMLQYYYTTNRNQPTQNRALSTAQPADATLAQAGPSKVYLPLITVPLGNNVVVGNPLTFIWNTSGVASGTYYICATAETAQTKATYCSETPVVVLP